MNSQHEILITELVKLLEGGGAHADLKKALKDMPAQLRSVKANNLPYTIWQMVEHIRIAQWDMLEFSKDGAHQSPKWPDEYWPKETAPADDTAWENSLKQIENNLNELLH